MADKFLSTVVSQHRLPECIVSNPHFHGNFLDELISLRDMTLIFSMAWQLQTDGMAEVMNHAMEKRLQIHA